MKFTGLLKKLEIKTFQEIIEEYNEEVEKKNEEISVECIGNEVYEDEDLYDFLEKFNAEIKEYNISRINNGHKIGKVIIFSEGINYKIPYEDRENRFGDDLPDETILFFDSIAKCQ